MTSSVLLLQFIVRMIGTIMTQQLLRLTATDFERDIFFLKPFHSSDTTFLGIRTNGLRHLSSDGTVLLLNRPQLFITTFLHEIKLLHINHHKGSASRDSTDSLAILIGKLVFV